MGEWEVRTAQPRELPEILAFWQVAAQNNGRPVDTPGALAALHRRDPSALIVAVDCAASAGAASAGAASDGAASDGAASDGAASDGVASDGVGIVGTIIAGWDGWRCHLYRLAVAPDRRREGIGRALIAAAEQRFRALGGTRADAMVLDDNGRAHRIWAIAGYTAQPEWSRWIKTL